ncbi:nucleoside hydrolase [Maribellus maritimus]|uniref:nucleoside hydrolase n=1 Tax=Maribellus maritimus TaxID=2870838 RepID=UPI001EEA6697|nr:nucleoside hydrolase [Maribellus maritimus]MCG6187343.1 nucleoside hydrolase [Maribellus maritimus]
MKKILFSISILFAYFKIYGVDEINKIFTQETENNVITILSTDLSIDRDPDDWFDLFLFLQLNEINASGIILDNYATNEVEKYANEFLAILKKENIPILKGVQSKLKILNDTVQASKYHDGAEFIIETMRKTSCKVRLIAVGSLRNEALAFSKDSILFMEKIENVYFIGGNWDYLNEMNIGLDHIAGDIILNSPIPIIWIPAVWSNRILFPGEYENQLYLFKDSVSIFLSDILKKWRIYRGEKFLKQTDQFPLGKNLWSFPALLHASGNLSENMIFHNGTISMSIEKEKINFKRQSEGKDKMLVERNSNVIIEWFWNLYRNSILIK